MYFTISTYFLSECGSVVVEFCPKSTHPTPAAYHFFMPVPCTLYRMPVRPSKIMSPIGHRTSPLIYPCPTQPIQVDFQPVALFLSRILDLTLATIQINCASDFGLDITRAIAFPSISKTTVIYSGKRVSVLLLLLPKPFCWVDESRHLLT